MQLKHWCSAERVTKLLNREKSFEIPVHSIVVSSRKLQVAPDLCPRRYVRQKQCDFGIGSVDSFDCFSTNGLVLPYFLLMFCVFFMCLQYLAFADFLEQYFVAIPIATKTVLVFRVFCSGYIITASVAQW